ncbi:MAG: sigma-70 family RNA polymerase sigma factor [Geobacteraceae bacterium]|nr:sigma-70 family RNA polymerase sigma factor [Geobacteraceae bacterium]
MRARLGHDLLRPRRGRLENLRHLGSGLRHNLDQHFLFDELEGRDRLLLVEELTQHDPAMGQAPFDPLHRLLERAHHHVGAFRALVDAYKDRLFAFIWRMVRDHHEAEDLTARVFQRAMNHIVNYTDRGVPFSAWLYRIAHNLVANWHRDRSRKQEIPLSEAPLIAKGDAPESTLVQTQQQDALLKLIRCLPAERQTLLILKFVEHMSNAEIGEIMGRSEGAVKSLYHRTLLALRDEIGDINDYSD